MERALCRGAPPRGENPSCPRRPPPPTSTPETAAGLRPAARHLRHLRRCRRTWRWRPTRSRCRRRRAWLQPGSRGRQTTRRQRRTGQPSQPPTQAIVNVLCYPEPLRQSRFMRAASTRPPVRSELTAYANSLRRPKSTRMAVFSRRKCSETWRHRHVLPAAVSRPVLQKQPPLLLPWVVALRQSVEAARRPIPPSGIHRLLLQLRKHQVRVINLRCPFKFCPYRFVSSL